jgi:hypothetical protein
MKILYSILAVVFALTIIGMVTSISTHQVYAPRTCAGCAEFKKLTTQFEKDVIDAASIDPPEPDRIQTLIDQYVSDVRGIDFTGGS